MPTTNPNQKMIVIHKEHPKSNFLQISNDHWMEANKKLTPYGLQLYLYFAKNANNYSFALSQQAAENEAGIKSTTFHKYVNILIAEGYLVPRNGNTYDFYETPHKQKAMNAECPPCGELPSSQGEQGSPPRESHSSSDGLILPQSNREINNKDMIDIIDIIQIETASQQQEERTNRAEEAEQGFIF